MLAGGPLPGGLRRARLAELGWLGVGSWAGRWGLGSGWGWVGGIAVAGVGLAPGEGERLAAENGKAGAER